VHVSHVNDGPHNLDQVSLLESLAETYLRMGDLETAKEAQDTIYALNIREFELDTMELVPALMRRAAWQHRAGFIFDERTTYRRVVRIVEEQIGRDAIELIEPLIMLGKSYFFIDTSGSDAYYASGINSGEIYFRRAVKIAEENPESNWQLVTQSKLSLADYYMYENNPQRARQVYAGVWELLSADDERLPVRYQQLEDIVVLKQRDLPQFVSAADSGNETDEEQPLVQSEDPLLQGTVKVAFTISTRGRASNIFLLGAEPAEFEQMVTNVVREVRRRIYRPLYRDGEAVESAEQRLEHNFFYRQSDLDRVRAASAGEQVE
jgi:tetratricopeptide (TPR) repeat protein